MFGSIACPLDDHGGDSAMQRRGSTGAKQGGGSSPNFTGISAPYEAPNTPELVLQGAAMPPVELAKLVLERLIQDKMLLAGG